MFSKFRTKSGMTVVELLVAITVFAIAAVLAGQSMISISASTNRAKLAQEIYDDTRYVMERMVKTMKEGTIDYEEYWNASVLTASGSVPTYGTNYSEYAKRFIDPGIDPHDSSKIDEYGSECVCIPGRTCGLPDEISPPCPADYKIASESIDEEIGRNPYDGNLLSANALCDGDPNCATISHKVSELYLINGAGTVKTFIKRIPNGVDDDLDTVIDDGDASDTGTEYIGLLKMNGADTKTSSGKAGLDGVTDSWANDSDYSDFLSIVPPNIEITQLDFYIAPLEDPWKGFNEEGQDIQMQPHITVVLTAKASGSRMRGISGPAPSITLQTTVTSRVLNGIRTF